MSRGSFLSASIGRKFLMSITGLFLVMFLLTHMSINLLMIFDDSGDLYNKAAHFMASTPMIQLIRPVLAIGFLVHIAWSFIITLQNMKARPIGYKLQKQSINSTWASRNMLILGLMLFVFIALHLSHFWYKMQITGDELLAYVTIEQGGVLVKMKNAYALVSTFFKDSILYSILYIVGGILTGLHISHGFWSAFQTIGLNNNVWRTRLFFLSNVIGWIFAIGYSIIPLYFMIKF